MSFFKMNGKKEKYSFSHERCIGRDCWSPGLFQSMAHTGSGLRSTSSPPTPCCMNRAYRGCPAGTDGERKEVDPIYGEIVVQGQPVFQIQLAKIRKAQGWRKV